MMGNQGGCKECWSARPRPASPARCLGSEGAAEREIREIRAMVEHRALAPGARFWHGSPEYSSLRAVRRPEYPESDLEAIARGVPAPGLQFPYCPRSTAYRKG